MELDAWQKEVIEWTGNICLRSGRQVGKSTVIGIKAGKFAVENPGKSIMLISATERQAYLLFSKVLGYLLDNHKKEIKSGKDRPTKTEIKLKNGTIIRCLPTGLDGIGIRGYTVDMLIADEAAFIPRDVWPAVTPMLATTKGVIILLSTPKGIDNYFYECYNNPAFRNWHVSSEDCPRIDKEFLEYEKKRLSNLQYKQEYLGEFALDLKQLFSEALIKSLMTRKRSPFRIGEHYLGVDVARMGEDQSTFEIFQRGGDGIMRQCDNRITSKTLITDTINEILSITREYQNIDKIFLDSGGMGAGVFDFLLQNPETRDKIIGIDNATRPIEKDGWDKPGKKKRLMKEQKYVHLLRLMEQGKIFFLDDEDIFFSLASVQAEYSEKGDLIIFNSSHRLSHIAEGIANAAWGANDKVNKLWIGYI